MFGADGELLVNSRTYPAPALSIAHARRFRQSQSHSSRSLLFPADVRTVSQTDVFNTTQGRSAPDGRFLGVVSIALRSDYFSSFYRDLTGGDPSLALGLYRQDGQLLVRYPGWPPGTEPAAHTPFTDALRDKELFGHVRMTSSVDGAERLLAFRRVGDYPLYVMSAYATDAIF